MSHTDQGTPEVAEALVRLSLAMENLQTRYEASERANRRTRMAIVVALLAMVFLMYRTVSPIAEQIGTIPQIIAQALPGARPLQLDPAEASRERQRLMDALSPDELARIEAFEKDQKWISDYIAASDNFDPGATIALFLSSMAQSVETMPALYTEVRSMTEAVHFMSNEMRVINEKLSSVPALAQDVHGMHNQMTALPLLANDVKGMHFYMSVMAKDLDATMGEAGRMMPWNW